VRYLALACDYDGTIAHDGVLAPRTLDALTRLKESGRRLILVTGRELDSLMQACPRLDLFDRVVAENGAVLYRPDSREQKPLTEPPIERLVVALRQRGVAPLSVGQGIVSTWRPNETIVLDVIRDLGLELHVVFNKGAVMVLPSGVNKATGVSVALGELALSPHNCVGIGDAENDHAFLRACEAAVVVANALPTIKERADLVTSMANGEGVVELVERLLADDLRSLAPKLARHAILIGRRHDGSDVKIEPYGTRLLIAGPSGSGKSTFTTGVMERIAEQGYQFCVIDPEGDYPTLADAIVLGNSETAPTLSEVLDLLAQPGRSAVVNLLGLPLLDRPGFFDSLMPRLAELRTRTGRPHWIILDEAHHLMPATVTPREGPQPEPARGLFLITVHPELLAPRLLASVDTVVATAQASAQVVESFCSVVGLNPPPLPTGLERGDLLAWIRSSGKGPFPIRSVPGQSERRRHGRKYAQGELGEDKSFYFRGPDAKLNLRAQNLALFVQLADGVDDQTWLHHLEQGDYSRWFRDAIKDEDLAEETAQVESLSGVSAGDSRARIRSAIEQRYTLSS
jgi:hydroxymethylpyrimidine pyrophosphatase-like HAD family hydrolase